MQLSRAKKLLQGGQLEIAATVAATGLTAAEVKSLSTPL
jgi:hypothetical protein